MNALLNFFKRMPEEKNRFALRALLVVVAVICQGFGVYWLTEADFGTDPCTVLNLGISSKIGFSYGNTLLFFNLLLFIIVILWGRREIGLGTLANMVLVGYSADITRWIFTRILPTGFFDSFKVRAIVVGPALIWFVVAAATYMAVDLGQSPYDSVPAIIARKLPKIPFMVVRMCWDGLMAVDGYLLGSTVGLVTVMMVFMLGPVITLIRKFLVKTFGFR